MAMKKPKFRHRVICFWLAVFYAVMTVGVSIWSDIWVIRAQADEAEEVGSWISCTISQDATRKTDSCTGFTTMMMLQNSTLLDEEWQFGEPGNPVLVTDLNNKYNGQHSLREMLNDGVTTIGGENPYTGGWYWSGGTGIADADLTKWTGGKLKAVQVASSDVSSDGFVTPTSYATGCITGMSGKNFQTMTHDELVSAMQILWDAGFFMIICGGPTGSTNRPGPGGGVSNAEHTSFVAGVTDDELYINDVWDGRTLAVGNWQPHLGCPTICFVICYYSDEVSPVEIAGGRRGQNGHRADLSTDESGNLVLGGFWSEEEFVPYTGLIEVPAILPAFDDLDINDQMAVRDWRDTIQMEKENRGITAILRAFVAFLGIVVILYAVFLYIAYQFDINQTFLDIQFLSIMTFGQIQIAPDTKKSTYGIDAHSKKNGTKFVVHRDMILICLTGITIGVLLTSGKIYALIDWVVRRVLKVFK